MATTLTTAEALTIVGTYPAPNPTQVEAIRTLIGARVLLDGTPVTVLGTCMCGCDNREQWVARFGMMIDLDRLVVQSDAQRTENLVQTCAPASRLTAP